VNAIAQPVACGAIEVNPPNVLTVLRILLVPVLVAALVSEFASDAVAAGVFVVASLTDALDGWLARRNRQESTFGKLMDPLADKLLVTAALVSLVALDRLSAGVAMVIIAREFAVTGLRQVAVEEGHVIAASPWGKLKTAMQIAMVLALIWVDGSPVWVDALVWATVVVTVVSGVDYFFGFVSLVRRSRRSHASVSHSSSRRSSRSP
jgi:CDP-diacylglycerol--glycerol-3-phosphate 3-phosphatidyltransferase